MLSEELVDLVDSIRKLKAEKQNIEVKSAHLGCPKRLYDTLSSFSNQDAGGILLFGLDEMQDFKPVGVYDLQDLQKKVTEQCNQMVPPVRAVFTSTVYEEVIICCAEIPPVDLVRRPCYYGGAGKVKGSYVRVGDADLPMSDYELYSYEAFKNHVHDDERIIEKANLSLLNQDELDNYILQMKRNRPGFSKLTLAQMYEMLSITHNGIPTLSSVLNFGIYPQGFLPQLAIIAVVVPGKKLGDTTSQGARFLDNKRIEGVLSNMLEESLSFCLRNMKTKTIIDPTSGQRKDVLEYPINALREAILNALIHRDYSSHTEGTPIQIYFYSDRIEIHSPGSLYGRISVEDLGSVRPDLRNPTLATMAEFLLHTENRYSGIPTIYREMKLCGLPKPVFENRRNEFVVILYNQPINEDERSIKDIVEFCKIPRTRSEIAEYLNLDTTYYVTKNYIQPLVREGKLKMTIPDKPKSKNQHYFSEDQ